MPTIDEVLDPAGRVKVISKLDLNIGFHQVRVCDEDIK